MKSEKLAFKNKEGVQLSARLDLPSNQAAREFALFAHCFTCNKNLTAIKQISRALTQEGFGVLVFDFTGLGNSEGEFESTSFSSNIEDLESAVDFLKNNYKAPSIIIGHSLGGAAAIFTASRNETLKAVVTIGAPYDPAHVEHLISNSKEQIEKEGKAEVNIGGRPFTIGKSFLEDLNTHYPKDIIKSLRRPLLILHSPQDNIVGIENAASIYAAAHHPKSFISLDGADHLMSNKVDSFYAGLMIANWVIRYLPEAEEKKLKSDSAVVVATDSSSFTTDIKAGKHRLIADEPESIGGNDFGPTPYGYLTAALGACTSMTIQMYAKRKEWPLKEVIVHLNHSKDYYTDAKTCETSESKIDQFERKIELIGDLNEEQKKRLLEIADKCPVHKSLHHAPKVITSLV